MNAEASSRAATTEKRFRTQWAAQFLVAAELVRRGYTVSFTMGNNTPIADLMVGTSTGKQFWVDVKGLSEKNDWIIKRKPDFQGLYYVLVRLAPLAEGGGSERQPDQFFVLAQDEINRLIQAYESAHPGTTMPGIPWAIAAEFKDHWRTLPARSATQF